ncbi:ABC transporter substrate-binding protein [Gordonia sp. HY442]|uniref:ABC transporter substrate-binding protein n=1 Tax=Gordonia zhenghanii TaxID=2911516 RepID=UPI001F384E1A|nr:ABC transporter substrate-binding protein [Gordonia zhenghanii]MCF8604543.1 ABC transporter substrate-binding protein [Gordonia zhenghanii]
MSGSRLRRVAALAAALAAAGTMLVACGDDEKGSSIDYLIDARVSDYNVNTPDGYAEGGLMALTRVLPGFSFIGPDGQIVADRDIGTATLTETSPMTVRYDFNRDAVYSDGRPMVCDDLVLAATALGGKARGFDAATQAGYRDIDKVDCKPGAKTATVTFDKDSSYREWRALFGAGTLLPAHVVGRLAGVSDVVGTLNGKNQRAIAKIADQWNTGFALKPGDEIDPEKFVASGPYRVESYSTDRGLRLVANEKWWGQKPVLGDVTVWPLGTDGAKAVDDGVVDVADTADVAEADKVAGNEAAPTDTDRSAARDVPPLAVTNLVFARTGIGSDVKVRQALATCMPRSRLARDHGSNGIVWSLRSAGPADSLGPSLNVQFGRRYPRSNVARARTLLEERNSSESGGNAKPVVRIGYPAGSKTSAAVVKAIADACGPAGLTVKDVSSPDFSVTQLGKGADALLSSGDTFAASGTASGIPAVYALYPGDPLNLSGYRDGAVGKAITGLSETASDSARLPLLRTIDTQAWDQLPTIPLYGAVRGREAAGAVQRVVPGMGRSGTGWNMDRWGVTG